MKTRVKNKFTVKGNERLKLEVGKTSAIAIDVKPGADAELFVRRDVGGSAGFSLRISIGKKSKVKCAIMNFGKAKNAESRLEANIGKESALTLLHFDCAKANCEFSANILQREKSALDYIGVGLGQENFRKNETVANVLEERQGVSNLLFKYVAKGKCRINSSGKAVIAKKAGGSSTYLLSKGLLLSDGAAVKMKPILEVNNAEVTAGHGASTSPISDDEMFYLQSRGIDEKESAMMITDGFVKSAYEKKGFSQNTILEIEGELHEY